jgi:hypothetical protein
MSPWLPALEAVFVLAVGVLTVLGRARGPVFVLAAVVGLGLAAARNVVALRRTGKRREWRRILWSSAIIGLAVIVAGVAFADVGKATGDPVRAAAEYRWHVNNDGLMYAMAEPPTAAEGARIEQAQGPEAIEAALARVPAVRIGGLSDVDGMTTAYSRVRVTLRGNRDEPVLIEGIRAVADCGPPLDGALFFGPPQGVDDVVDVAFDLDDDDPNARVADRDGLPTSTPYVDEHSITLRRDEAVVLDARAYTASQHCSWEIQLDIQGEDQPQSIRAADGRPFEVTSVAQAETYESTYVLDFGQMAFDERPLPDYFNEG